MHKKTLTVYFKECWELSLEFLLCIDRPVGVLLSLKLNNHKELETVSISIREHTARLFGKAEIMKLMIDSSQVHLTSFKIL